MTEYEYLEKLTGIIERLPLGRMRYSYIKKREELTSKIKKRKEESEKIEALIDIAKQMKVECFMCKEIIEKFENNQTLNDADRYHIVVDIPSAVRLKGFNGKVLVSIQLFVNKIL